MTLFCKKKVLSIVQDQVSDPIFWPRTSLIIPNEGTWMLTTHVIDCEQSKQSFISFMKTFCPPIFHDIKVASQGYDNL